MALRLSLLVLGLFNLANALAMLVFPAAWAASAVHRTAPSPLEFHFIADIGMAYLASGLALAWSVRPQQAAWALAGAAWPALHAAIHLREWLMDGLPTGQGDVLREGIGVIVTGMAGLVLAWARQRRRVPT